MNHRKRQSFIVLCILVLMLSQVMWQRTKMVDEQIHYQPAMEKKDLSQILEKEVLTEKDYQFIFWQTGVGPEGVKTLDERKRRNQLISIQNRFFEPVETRCTEVFRGYHSEIITSKTRPFIPVVETGDIVISLSGHVGGWRTGHAGLVVDGQKGLVLEAVEYGQKARIKSISHWKDYPTMVVCRVKNITEEDIEKVVSYATEELQGLPYDVLAFKMGEKNLTKKKTQCAHLVWCAYAQAGYDLDVDGTFVVTPYDILYARECVVVQTYGIDPGKLSNQL